MTRPWVYAFAFFLAFSSCASPSLKYPSEDPELEFSLSKSKLEPEISESSDSSWSDYSDRTGQEKLRIKKTSNVSPQDADEIIAAKTKDLRDLFRPMMNAYFGSLDVNYKCRDKVIVNRPVQNSSVGKSVWFDLLATRELLYGTCTENQEIFRSQYLICYCQNTRTLYEIGYYYPKEKAFPQSQIARCLH